MDDTECPAYAQNNIKNWGREAYTVWYFMPADIKESLILWNFYTCAYLLPLFQVSKRWTVNPEWVEGGSRKRCVSPLREPRDTAVGTQPWGGAGGETRHHWSLPDTEEYKTNNPDWKLN